MCPAACAGERASTRRTTSGRPTCILRHSIPGQIWSSGSLTRERSATCRYIFHAVVRRLAVQDHSSGSTSRKLSYHCTERQDDKGRTALARCAGGGDDTCVRLLLQANADVDLADKSGISPLHYVRSGFSLLSFLRRMRAKKMSPVERLPCGPLKSPDRWRVVQASLSSSYENVTQLLQYEALVNTFDKTNGSSPLHDACFAGALK